MSWLKTKHGSHVKRCQSRECPGREGRVKTQPASDHGGCQPNGPPHAIIRLCALEWSPVSLHLPDSSPQETSCLASLPVIPQNVTWQDSASLSGTERLEPLECVPGSLSCCGEALDEEEAPGPVEAHHVGKGAGRRWGEGEVGRRFSRSAVGSPSFHLLNTDKFQLTH